jgi:zinc protease
LRELAGGGFDPKRIAATEELGVSIRGITPASLQATAAKYLKPERDWTLKVVPKGK